MKKFAAYLSIVALIAILIPQNISFADAVSVSCNGTDVTEGDLASDEVTFQDGGDGICTINAAFTPSSITIENGVTLINDATTTASGNVNIESGGTLEMRNTMNANTVTVESGGTVTHTAEDDDGATFSVTNFDLQSGGIFNVNNKGCRGGGQGVTRGTGTNQDGFGQAAAGGSCTESQGGYGAKQSNSGGLGGSHGGHGGGGTSNGGGINGDELTPDVLGSGGGQDNLYGDGGYGGGLIAITATGTTTISGTMSANGENGVRDAGFTGGGGGAGSIVIDTNALAGDGDNIEAIGGGGESWTHVSYSGGGGRVSLKYNTSTMTNITSVDISGGTGGNAGGLDGTLVIVDKDAPTYTRYCYGTSANPQLVDASDYNALPLILEDPTAADSSDGYCYLDAAATVSGFTVNSGVTWTSADENKLGQQVTSTGDITINSGGKASADAKGCYGGGINAPGEGSHTSDGRGPDGAGDCAEGTAGYGDFIASVGGAGAGYGNDGGNNSSGSGGGSEYGVASLTPSQLGSGGSQGNDPTIGGHGGGYIKLVAAGTLTINGELTANGQVGSSNVTYGGGGGSGGSITLDANLITGTTGKIEAKGGPGGDGSSGSGGGGAGGRIGAVYNTDTFKTTGVAANADADGAAGGSSNGRDGGNGSITTGFKPGVTVTESGGSTDVTEGSTTDTYTLVLKTEPSDDVVITVTPTSDIDLGSGAGTAVTKTFTDANWNVAQTVNVTAVDDSIDEDAETPSITHSAASSDGDYNGVSISSVTANITDNDTASVTVTETDGDTIAVEGGSTDTFDLTLATEPTADVTITMTPGADYSISPTGPLTFTNANWSVAQTITITATDDNSVEGSEDQNTTFSATSADGKYDSIAIGALGVTITDNDTATATIAESDGDTLATEGSTDTYTLVLDSQPTADVTVNVTADADTSVDSETLTFTNGNWNVAQTITITATDDNIDEDSEDATISHSSTSADGNFNGMSINDTTITITDNDTAAVTLSASSGAVAEGSTSTTFTAVLSSEPTADVTIAITGDGQLSASPTSLTFTSANWSTAQNVTVSAVDDTSSENDHSGTLSFAATSVDSKYNAISISTFTATITDNDNRGSVLFQRSTGGNSGGGVSSSNNTPAPEEEPEPEPETEEENITPPPPEPQETVEPPQAQEAEQEEPNIQELTQEKILEEAIRPVTVRIEEFVEDFTPQPSAPEEEPEPTTPPPTPEPEEIDIFEKELQELNIGSEQEDQKIISKELFATTDPKPETKEITDNIDLIAEAEQKIRDESQNLTNQEKEKVRQAEDTVRQEIKNTVNKYLDEKLLETFSEKPDSSFTLNIDGNKKTITKDSKIKFEVVLEGEKAPSDKDEDPNLITITPYTAVTFDDQEGTPNKVSAFYLIEKGITPFDADPLKDGVSPAYRAFFDLSFEEPLTEEQATELKEGKPKIMINPNKTYSNKFPIPLAGKDNEVEVWASALVDGKIGEQTYVGNGTIEKGRGLVLGNLPDGQYMLTIIGEDKIPDSQIININGKKQTAKSPLAIINPHLISSYEKNHFFASIINVGPVQTTPTDEGATIKIAGYAEPLSEVHLAMQSVLLTSVVISDSSGYFEINLEVTDDNEHTVVAYTNDNKNGYVSDYAELKLRR